MTCISVPASLANQVSRRRLFAFSVRFMLLLIALAEHHLSLVMIAIVFAAVGMQLAGATGIGVFPGLRVDTMADQRQRKGDEMSLRS